MKPELEDIDLKDQAGQQTEAQTEAERTPEPQEDAGIKVLKEQLAAEQRRRSEADARAREATERAAAAQADMADGRLKQFDTAINLAKSEVATAKRLLKEAGEIQDWDRFAEAQAVLNDAIYKQNRLNEGRDHLESQLRIQKAEGAVRPREAEQDPVERFAAQLSPSSAAWLRQHPECVQKPALNHRMIAAHHDAIESGIATDSRDYFAFIERSLGFTKADPEPANGDGAESDQSSIPAIRKTPAAAPVSRSVGTATTRRAPAEKLAPHEIDYCKRNNLNPDAYLRSKLEAMQAGKIKRA